MSLKNFKLKVCKIHVTHALKRITHVPRTLVQGGDSIEECFAVSNYLHAHYQFTISRVHSARIALPMLELVYGRSVVGRPMLTMVTATFAKA